MLNQGRNQKQTPTVNYFNPTSSTCHLRTAAVEITSVKSSIMFLPVKPRFQWYSEARLEEIMTW